MELIKDEILNLIIGKGESTISKKIVGLLSEEKYKKFFKEIPRIVEERVLFPMEGERFFDDLHSFYLGKNIVPRFVVGYLSTNDNSVSYMVDKFSEDFINEYPQHKIFKMRIKELLEESANIINFQIKEDRLVPEDQEIVLFIAQKCKEISEVDNSIASSVAVIRSEVNGMRKDVDKLVKQFANTQNDSNPNVSPILSIGQLEDDTQYSVEIRKIEEELQNKIIFGEAITKYNELINDIKENVKDQGRLLTHIYINLALCYGNKEEYERPYKSLGYAKKYCDWENNANYYYVEGYICWKENRNNVNVAIQLLDQAIAIDPKHVYARMLRCELGAFNGEEKNKVLTLLNEVEDELSTDKRRADFFAAKGIIYKAYAEYNLAEEWMLKAEKEKHSIENLINLGILYYSKATVNNQQEKRLLKVEIDYPEIFKAFECFQKVKQEITQDEFKLYRKDFLDVYISTCILCETPEQIESIQMEEEEISELDYETQRSIIFHEALKGNSDNINLLCKEDKTFLSFVDKAESGKLEEAFQSVLHSIYDEKGNDLERKYNFALQLTIELKHLDEFKHLRKNLISNKIECPYLELYDAKYYDIIGETGKSKKFYDSHLQENDGLYLLNAILFYRNHSFNVELKQAYCIILRKICNREIAVNRQEKIIQDAFVFLADHDIELALELLTDFDNTIISENIFRSISETIYSKIMNVTELINIYESSEENIKCFDQRLNYIILLKYNLQFDRAKEEAEKMIDLSKKESRDRQIKLLELLSELCLFTDDLEKSAKYITEAKNLAQDLVYDPVHQLYMTRMIRCGKKDGLIYGIEFKHTHPNVVNWLSEFEGIETDEQGETKLTDEARDILDNLENRFDVALEYYKNQLISFYQLQKLLGSDLLAMLSIPDNYNFKFVVGLGSVKKLNKQKEKIVIDIMTLMFIKYFNLLALLDRFSIIYLTYSSVEELERLFILFGSKFIDDLIVWIKNDLRVNLYPNYNRLNEQESLFHPNYFMDSLAAAKREDCHFLCIDGRVPLLFSKDQNYFINLISLVNSEEGDESSLFKTKLLAHNVTFVNFSANDIIYSLNNEIEEKIFNKFFAIDCGCDSSSFINVYYSAIMILLSSPQKDNKLDKLLFQICKQIDRTFSRARMCRWRVREYRDVKENVKYMFYVKHNIMLLFMLKNVFKKNDKIWNKICNYSYKYFNVSILDKIYGTDLETNKINQEEIVRDLIGYYSL